MLLNPKTLKSIITCIHTTPEPIAAIRIAEAGAWQTTTYSSGHIAIQVEEHLDVDTSDTIYYLNAIDLNLILKHLSNIPFNILQPTANMTYEIAHPTATFTITNEDSAHSRSQFEVIDNLLDALAELDPNMPRTVPAVNTDYLAAATKAITQVAGKKTPCSLLALDKDHPLYVVYRSVTLQITVLIMPLMV